MLQRRENAVGEPRVQTGKAELFVGTSGYAYKAWKGSFYPNDLPQAGMLHFYGTQFRAVEINNTFYRSPKREVLQKWAADVPPGFRFSFKAPQRITHFQRFKDSGDSVSYLFKTLEVLDDALGPVLFQTPPDFRRDAGRLRDFLATLPPQAQVAFEFRHASWFDDEILQLLLSHQAALCISETETGPVAPVVPTAKWGYLRLRRPDYDEASLTAWSRRIQESWPEAYVFFKHEEEGKGPQLARKFRELAR